MQKILTALFREEIYYSLIRPGMFTQEQKDATSEPEEQVIYILIN